MERYVRPAFPSPQFRDAEGNVIPYGERWREDGPPDYAHSVLTHPERFRPLHDVARALIAYLTRTYDVVVSEDPVHLAELPRGTASRTAATSAVRLIPASRKAAPLTVAFAPYPGIVLHAGALYCESFPGCGCDACDDSWDPVASEFEFAVFAVVEGGFSEQVTRWPRAAVGYTLEREDRWKSGNGKPGADLTPHRLATARERIAEIGGSWEPWRPRGVS